MKILALVLLAFTLNLPFGFWRVHTRKFSLWWFLAIHLPIPFIFLFRHYSGLSYVVIPFSLLAAIIGQILGGKAFSRNSRKARIQG